MATSPDASDASAHPPELGSEDALDHAPLDPQAPSVVGIGASAGGIAALRDFFANTPPDSGLAFVVVVHLSPEHKSNLASVLQSVTSMPIIQVERRVAVAPNHVYVIPPAKRLIMSDGHLALGELDRSVERQVAIDLFFRTMAEVQGRNATAVVLSGAGSDGSLGLGRVKEFGGTTIVQEPDEAEYPGMPRSAIATGLVDFVLPVAQIPARIIAFQENAEIVRLPASLEQHDSDSEALRELFVLMRVRSGHDFANYKRSTVLRRIGRRLQVNSLADLPAYVALMRERPGEVQALLRDLLISVTNFFRDAEAFQTLETMIPGLFAGKQPDDQLRVWVAGCATGEEAYSVAILLREYAARLEQPPALQVFATDIDEDAIITAREGLYPENIVADVSVERLRRFFTNQQGGYRIKKEIRDMVLFAAHNLLRDPPFSRLDLITCRNLLIYLDRGIQERVLELFHFVLRPDGRLMLGSSESADSLPGLFTVIDKKNRIYGRRNVAPATPLLPSMPLVGMPERATPSAEPSAPQRAISFGELHHRLLEEYAAPSLIVDETYEIVHLSERAGRFLHMSGGEPSYNLLKIVHSDLRIELRNGLFRAGQQLRPSEARNVRVQLDGDTRLVNIFVRPAQDPEGARGFLLVIFEEVGLAGQEEPGRSLDNDTEPMMRQLDEELKRLREQLRMTIEQYETSTEELKASNEELQAMNEELRSTTEELETSKEELQSVNEELVTVNQELKTKVDEINRVNSDLQNLMASTDIGIVFLDRELQVKHYTRVQELFNLIPTDISRPLNHVTHQLRYEGLLDDSARVLDRLMPIDREVQHADGRWFLARLLPYRTLEDKIDGVVLTFVDITERKRGEEELRQALLVNQQQKNALEQLVTSVEAQVAERTRELARTNSALEAEAAVRRQAEEERRTLLRRLVRAQEEERQRISRELHDQVGQQLTGLALGLQALRANAAEQGDLIQHINQMQAIVDALGSEMHQLALELRPTALDDMGLLATLASYAEQWSRRSGIPLVFHPTGFDNLRLPPDIETTLYRVTLEALTNVVKHAQASRASLIMEHREGSVVAIIEDNGRGFEADELLRTVDARGRLGLLSMQERVELVGGTLVIESAPGKGTTVFARVPLPAANASSE